METYKKPIYNPFQDLNPPVGMIKEVIKSLKQQAYATQRKSQEWTNQGWPVPSWITDQHRKLNARIKDYQYKVDNWTKSGGWASNVRSGITEQDIRAAKDVPITSLYTGVLRRRGKLTIGLCPFHAEKTGSFTIYTDNNRFTCFGCNISGDSIDYIMKRDQVSFFEAVKYLLNL